MIERRFVSPIIRRFILAGAVALFLSFLPITVIAKKKGVTLKKYPEHYIPGKEKLGDNEMRITVLGSGSPTPVRRAQATSGILVELGNGENFIFDIGAGTTANLYSMGIHPALLSSLSLMPWAGPVIHLFLCGGHQAQRRNLAQQLLQCT
jgi:hypothetical protein